MSDWPGRLKPTEQTEWMPMLEGGKARNAGQPKPPVDKK